jgi:hypothetical protein
MLSVAIERNGVGKILRASMGETTSQGDRLPAVRGRFNAESPGTASRLRRTIARSVVNDDDRFDMLPGTFNHLSDVGGFIECGNQCAYSHRSG